MAWFIRAFLRGDQSPFERDRLRKIKELRRAQKKGERQIVKQLKRGAISHEEALEYVSRTGCGSLLQFFPENLRDDRLVVAAAIAQPDQEIVYDRGVTGPFPTGSPLEYASSTCRQDRELVLEAVSFSAGAYNYASEELRSDPDIYLAAARAEIVQTEGWRSDHLIDCYTVACNKLGEPNLNDSFYSDAVGLYEFVVGLERLIDSDNNSATDDIFDALYAEEGPDAWAHAGDNYEEHFLNMFQDWEVVCRVLGCMATSDDPLPSFFEMYKAKWSERYEAYAPENLYHDENGVKTDQITNRAFVLYALKAGQTHVMNWVTDTLKNDPEVSKWLYV